MCGTPLLSCQSFLCLTSCLEGFGVRPVSIGHLSRLSSFPASVSMNAMQDGGLEDALGILERTMNPESLLSLFSGGELQV